MREPRGQDTSYGFVIGSVWPARTAAISRFSSVRMVTFTDTPLRLAIRHKLSSSETGK